MNTFFEKLLNLDADALLWIQDNVRTSWLTPVMKFITSLGNVGMIWICFVILMLVFKKSRRAGITAAISISANFIILNLLIKNLVARTRPYEVIDGLNRLIPPEKSFSFPSGHAGNSFAVAVVMLVMLPRKYGIPAFVLAILISFSRLYVGVHYPTDVLGAIIIGTIVATITMLVMKKSDREKT